MNKKVFDALTAINGRYNFPKGVLEHIANMSSIESDDEVESWIGSIQPMLALMQSYADSRVNSAMKELRSTKDVMLSDTDLENKLGAMLDDRLVGLTSKIEALTALNQELQERVNISERVKRETGFVELKKRVASELGLSDKALSLIEGKLNAEMSEDEVNKVLSDGKKALVELGLTQVEGKPVNITSEEVISQRADAFLEKFKAENLNNIV